MDANFLQYFLRSRVGGWTEAVLLEKERTAVVRSEFVNAAAWLVTADCLRKAGGFDPIFFHYGEDDNYAQRVIHWGFGIGVLTCATIRHDRESRPDAANLSQQMKMEWVRILIWACNIRRSRYRGFIVRRSIRHGLRAALALLMLKPSLFRYHFTLAVRTIGHMGKVGGARRRMLQPGAGLL